MEKVRTYLITGVAGFIGYHLAARLLAAGCRVIGIDNINDYYDVKLKFDRLAQLGLDSSALLKGEKRLGAGRFLFYRLDICDHDSLQAVFAEHSPGCVAHLAAQAGVRYSLQNPFSYINSNISGFLNILECCRHHPVEHLVFASSSSVYGANRAMPFSEQHNVDHPLSLYAASKKSNELMAHTYAHLFAVPATGLRFFTVYGPWGRPDMALFNFTRSILAGRPIEIYNHGNMKRDFTYIDDIVEGVVRVLELPPAPDPGWNAEKPDPASSAAPYRVFNIGHNQPVELLAFIELIEEFLGRKAERIMLPMQPGDVSETCAAIDKLQVVTGYRPQTPVREGVAEFINWYREYYK